MKSVIDIDTLAVIKVDDSDIECSVCGQYKPESSYRKKGEQYQSRTNCFECYNLPSADFNNKKVETKKIKTANAYKKAVSSLQAVKRMQSNSVSVEEMIVELQKLPAGSRLIMTQEGYYADGDLGYIFFPSQFDVADGVHYYSIGQSIQNY